jgi:hypothetical protein
MTLSRLRRSGIEWQCRSSKTSAPMRSPLARTRQAASAATRAATTDFMALTLPKNMLTRWSTSSSTLRSRSSVYTRTWGLPVRRVTFQSRLRMSSPGW